MGYVVVAIIIIVVLLIVSHYLRNNYELNDDGNSPILRNVPRKYYDADGRPTIGGFTRWILDGAPGFELAPGGIPIWLIILIVLYILTRKK